MTYSLRFWHSINNLCCANPSHWSAKLHDTCSLVAGDLASDEPSSVGQHITNESSSGDNHLTNGRSSVPRDEYAANTSTNEGAGCCATLLCLGLVSALLMLAGLIYIQLHPLHGKSNEHQIILLSWRGLYCTASVSISFCSYFYNHRFSSNVIIQSMPWTKWKLVQFSSRYIGRIWLIVLSLFTSLAFYLYWYINVSATIRLGVLCNVKHWY